jgi:hypothetical protein
MSATIAECLERARQCEWHTSRTNDERGRKFLLWKAQQWMKLVQAKELLISGPCTQPPDPRRSLTRSRARCPAQRPQHSRCGPCRTRPPSITSHPYAALSNSVPLTISARFRRSRPKPIASASSSVFSPSHTATVQTQTQAQITAPPARAQRLRQITKPQWNS